MICQECQQKPATLHFTKFVNGEKIEIRLCEKCSQEKSEMFMANGGSNFSIHNLLAGLLNIEQSFSQAKQSTISNTENIICDHCHMSYSQFARVGRFGCAHCYETFNEQLEPILKRLHSGNTVHKGKIPERIGGSITLRKKIKDLKQQLNVCIEQEEFEKAAEIRDEIRALEKEPIDNESGNDDRGDQN